MRRPFPLAILALGLAGPTLVRAEAPTFTVETIGGTRLVGTLALDSIQVECEFGDLKVSVEKLRTLSYAADGDTIVTTSGFTIKGKIQTDPIRVESDLGPFTLSRDRLKSIEARSGSRESQPAPTPAETPRPAEPTQDEPMKDEDPALPPQRPIPPFLLHSAAIVTAPPAPPGPRPCHRSDLRAKVYPPSQLRDTRQR